MIPYELAKELKEAGFPQPDISFGKNSDRLVSEDSETNNFLRAANVAACIGLKSYDYAYAPTLSELIEACGVNSRDVAFLLIYAEGEWMASHSTGESNQTDKKGSTPEEAVARLWLAMNKK